MFGRKQPHILLIEDNPADVSLIKENLMIHITDGHFTIAQDGEQAMTYLKKQEAEDTGYPDLIILDLNLPKVDGFEILSYIKSSDNFKQTPVVVFSTSSADKDIRRVYSGYANCYVVKPFDLDEFQNAIKKIWEFWFEVSKLPESVR